MRRTILGILVAGGIASILAMSAAPSFAKTVKECDDEYAANKAAIKASGQTKRDYVAACRGETATAPAAVPAAAPAPAPAAPAAPAAANAKPTKDCDAEYAANKAAIKAGGQTKRDFVAACRSGTEVIPTGSAAAPAAPAPAPAAPAAVPAPAPQVAPAPAPVAPKPQVGATGAGGFKPTRKRVRVALRTPSCGSTRSLVSITSRERITTATRSKVRTCARRTRRRPATARLRMKSIPNG